MLDLCEYKFPNQGRFSILGKPFPIGEGILKIATREGYPFGKKCQAGDLYKKPSVLTNYDFV